MAESLLDGAHNLHLNDYSAGLRANLKKMLSQQYDVGNAELGLLPATVEAGTLAEFWERLAADLPASTPAEADWLSTGLDHAREQ